MTNEIDVLYEATATAHGDGRAGRVTSDDDVLDLALAVPRELGGAGGDLTNPEQLFAAGYSACFHSALKRVCREARVDASGSTVTATVGIGRTGDTFALQVELQVSIPSASDGQAEDLVRRAHRTCPYSRAVSGNVPLRTVVVSTARAH